MISAIYDRRSIRKFIDKPIPQKDIIDIIQSGIKAPSSKNRQPWKYIVIQGDIKEEMLEVFRQGIEREENDSALLPESRQAMDHSYLHSKKLLLVDDEPELLKMVTAILTDKDTR